ncbi:MAG: hypothetical protein ACJAQT_003678 [Akkermansiaceae bacterium]|jgi:hypothetical protein
MKRKMTRLAFPGRTGGLGDRGFVWPLRREERAREPKPQLEDFRNWRRFGIMWLRC